MSESKSVADDLLHGRKPTSHERNSGRSWDASYQDGPAPWDIGRPQPAMAGIITGGHLAGPVLDSGCGTGEHALLAASLGLPVLGVDVAETALAMARKKAAKRGIAAEFASADALNLNRLSRLFRTVLDSGLFHTFDSAERPAYVASLATVTEAGGTLYVLCFSDQGPGTGPHPVAEEDLRTAFSPNAGWNIVALSPDRIHTRFHENGAPAWLATMQRI
jgi:SAM-dependent methyltransferase